MDAPRSPRLIGLKSFWVAVVGFVCLLGLWGDSMKTVTFAGYFVSPLWVQVEHYHSALGVRVTTGAESTAHYWLRESAELNGEDMLEDYRERSVFPAASFKTRRDGKWVFRKWTLPYWLILPNYLLLAAGVVIWRRRVAGRRLV